MTSRYVLTGITALLVACAIAFGIYMQATNRRPPNGCGHARLKARIGWDMPWYTITDGFDADFGVEEWHGHNVFFRDGERAFRTYFINNRGDEAMGTTWSYLDLTPLERQETWKDSPEGYPQTPPYKWWNWHDEYGPRAAPDPQWVEVSDTARATWENA